MNNLLAIASTTSLFGNSTTPLQEQFEQRIPGFGVLQGFFKKWLKLELTTVLTIAALMGAASSGVQSLQATGSKLYWWIVRFLTASISIAGNDRLNREVLNWLGSQVLGKEGNTRILTAHSETIQNDAWYYRRVAQERNDYHHEKRMPVEYLPTFGTTWFVHERNIFMVRRILTSSSRYHSSFSKGTPDEYAGAPEGNEPLVVMCLGRSVQPIKRFLNMCRDFSDKQREAFVTVRTSKRRHYEESWDTTILRPLRPLETVHFDEKIKAELVADIINYLDSNTRKFYNGRGIPYRRGYLLHGPPGTGKTSLSLALAGVFGLELYLLHIPSVREDENLEKLFTALPPRCIVLLEDIDAVGIKRRPAKKSDDTDDENDDDDDIEEDNDRSPRSRCTLSGLLNVLDGVASQEGRIVLMTSNFAEKLDKALVRPGRVDRMIYLGNISKRSAELMFLRMYNRDGDGPATAEKTVQMSEEELKVLAVEFSAQIPDNVFTPAQLQGYLLNHRDSPVEATKQMAAWAKEEQTLMEEAKERARKAAEHRRKKKKELRLKMLAKAAKEAKKEDTDADDEKETKALMEKIEKEEAEKKLKKDDSEKIQKETSGDVKSSVDVSDKEKAEDDKKLSNGDAVTEGEALTNGTTTAAEESDKSGNAETESTVAEPAEEDKTNSTIVVESPDTKTAESTENKTEKEVVDSAAEAKQD